MCAPLRRPVSHVPSPVERWGIEEKAKITAAHANTGSQTVRTRDRVIAADARLRLTTSGERQGTRAQIRSAPAAVRGDAPASRATGPQGWEGDVGRAPRVRRP